MATNSTEATDQQTTAAKTQMTNISSATGQKITSISVDTSSEQMETIREAQDIYGFTETPQIPSESQTNTETIQTTDTTSFKPISLTTTATTPFLFMITVPTVVAISIPVKVEDMKTPLTPVTLPEDTSTGPES